MSTASRNPFRQATFVLSAPELRQLPADDGAEITFAGRSNAGKSSALNAICDQTGLARTSKTPGRTQQFVVFALGEGQRLVDLPGYGYAKVPEPMRAHWRKVIDAYLRERQSLRAVVLIIDCRHPLKEFDRQVGALLGLAKGVLLCTVITLLADSGLKVQEKFSSRDELYIADEIFLTGTAAEITPVGEIDAYRFTPGQVTRTLIADFEKLTRAGAAKAA